MRMTRGSFDREIQFTPAYDKRNPNPKKNYGIGGVDVCFLLHGKEGSVQFRMSSGWDLKHVREERENRHLTCDLFPMAVDLGYHWSKARYKDQGKMDCTYLEQGLCFYDGSTLNAEPVMNAFFEKGEGEVWRRLIEFYDDLATTKGDDK